MLHRIDLLKSERTSIFRTRAEIRSDAQSNKVSILDIDGCEMFREKDADVQFYNQQISIPMMDP